MANTKNTLETTFKYVQEKTLNDLKPNSSILQDICGPIKAADQLGRKFLWPVCLSYELGFTFGDGTGFTYNDDVAGTYDEIEIDPNPVVLKSRISIEAADRMAKSDKAVLNHVAMRSGQMKSSLMKMAEIEMLYGRSAVGIGVVSAVSAVNTVPNPDELTITISAATWAPGIWGGMEGAKLEVRDSSGVKQNTNGDLTLVSVDYDSKQIVVSGDNADLTAVAQNHIIYFKGAYTNGQYGIHYQMDTSGTVFGIDNSSWSLWKANEFAVGGALTIAKVLEGAAKAVGKGGLDEDAVLLISATTFESLNSDIAALRRQDASYKASKGELGVRGITYHAQFGKVEVVAHPFLMEGYAYLFPRRCIKKVGATDITFGVPGKTGEYFECLEGSHAYQLTGRYSFQVLLSEPAKCVLYTGITN